MSAKHLGLTALAAVVLAGNATVALAQQVDTTTATVPVENDDVEGNWGLLGLLGLAGLLGLKRRDRDDHRTTTHATGTSPRR